MSEEEEEKKTTVDREVEANTVKRDDRGAVENESNYFVLIIAREKW